MSVSNNKQIEFYDWQLFELDMSWAVYHRANVIDLYASNELYIGRIWGYDEKRGILILRFKEGKFPRLKEPLTISYPKASIGPMQEWGFSYRDFREYHVEQYSNCNPVYFLENKENEAYRYVGFKNISIEFMQHIATDLKKRTQSIVILGAEDPPREYLVALKNFTKNNPGHPVLNLSGGEISSWRPKNLSDTQRLASDVIDILDNSEKTIIQGPPGTGKTHLIAELCQHYLSQKKRVCITALTHKALMEAAIKDGLYNSCKSGNVFKTNLSADESALIPELYNHDAANPIPPGNLLLATYYSLSKLLKEETNVFYDLLIIEEASQAFLTTIAGFSSLAKKVLVVGDFMQLQPIVLAESKAINIDPNIFTIINGLKTFSINNTPDSYRLVNTYRLSRRASAQTGVFYDNSLISKSNKKGLQIDIINSSWLCPEGGASVFYFDKMDEGIIPKNAISLIITLVKKIKENHPNIEIAVLAAFKDTVNAITDSMLRYNINFEHLEVNTIDRIQGMTVDFCIYLVPSYKTKFSYNPNRFNVGTSRAKHGTLILAEKMISDDILLPKDVYAFLAKAHKIEIPFRNE
jgi:superfamily I DNA and/or RNA helicase